MVLDVLKQAIYSRDMPESVIHHMRSTAPQEACNIYLFVSSAFVPHTSGPQSHPDTPEMKCIVQLISGSIQ